MENTDNSHRKHELRSLAMHRLVAQALKQDPVPVIRIALENIPRWKNSGADCDDFDLWRKALHGPTEEIIKILSGTDETSTRLRQSSLFPGVIPQQEREKILAAFP